MTQTDDLLVRGREALKNGDWEAAKENFERAIAEAPTAAAYEGLGSALWWLNDDEALFPARDSAFRLYREAGDPLGAARVALDISMDYADFRGELAIANGWRQRSARLLQGQPTASEHGWLAMAQGEACLLYDDNVEEGLEHAREAIAVGRMLGIADVEVMGLAMEGIALVTMGKVADGMSRLDEAATALLSGEFEQRFTAAWALCYLIFACERVRDVDRATQWCRRLEEFSELHDLAISRGICRAHYAAILIWRGNWDEAESELALASATLEQQRRPFLVGESIVRLAELRRRQGRLDEAVELFEAVEGHPLATVGLAEILLDRGRPLDARDLIEQLLRQIPESARTQRGSALELMARIEALLGNPQAAARAQSAVEALSDAVPTVPLRAAAAFSAGSVAVAAREFERARTCLEDALVLYERGGAPYEAARVRLELAAVLVTLHRPDRARREAQAALETLQRLGSTLYAGRAAALLRTIGEEAREATPGPLTARQLEILRLISQGLGDRAIAERLVVSEHTVHRHVANILQRLDVPSRASAVALASSRGLL